MILPSVRFLNIHPVPQTFLCVSVLLRVGVRDGAETRVCVCVRVWMGGLHCSYTYICKHKYL